MIIISTRDDSFPEVFTRILRRNISPDSSVEDRVRKIIIDIRERKDEALLEYTKKFDGWNPQSPEDLIMTKKEIAEAEKYISKEDKKAIEIAAKRIEKYHKTTFPGNIIYRERGAKIERIVIPLESVGIYCPGGKAGYPSTVLMTAIPAIVAGVKNIYLATPAVQGKINPYTVFTANVLGIDKIFKIGGAQAIAALAFGTKIVPPVDKIAGPGNIYVATAKRLVQGACGIDIIAGPSELVAICDGSVYPLIPAIDIIAQAEHDERAMCVVVCHIEPYLNQVKNMIYFLMKIMPRRDIIEEAFRSQSALIVTRNLEESIEIVNRIAPEHVGVLTKNPIEVARKIKNAGTIFVGKNSPPAIGDYIAGPSHVLPTGGTARFASGLSVDDFVKRTNIIFFTKRRMIEISEHAVRLAKMEGLFGHAFSIEKRYMTSIKSLDYVLNMYENETKNQKGSKR
ncbi:Histidinol dehydrogenase [bacterium HR19]|nr:Histidinol dehydrogenase [bacterium HR19]